ncbi:MAG: beta-propeller domain-containing protein, partial [Marmoricola sp.]
MTDLENAWDRYPTSPAPLSEIMSNGRPARQMRFARPAFGGLVAAGVAVALAITLNTGNGAGTAASQALIAHPPLKLAAFQADLKPAASCTQLLNTYRKRGLKQVSAYGWNGGGVVPLAAALSQGPMVDATGAAQNFSSKAVAPQAQATGQANSSTGTNVQEVGVDEPDGVKTNGSLLVRIDGDTIAVYDLTGTQPVRVSTIALPYFDGGQILLSGTTVVALGTNTEPAANPTPTSRVVTVSLARPSQPQITSNVTYGGTISSARQHGTTIRLVLTTGLPNLRFAQPDANGSAASTKRALAANRRLVATSTLAQWLPTVDTGNGSQQLLDCNNVAVTPASVALGTTSVVGFDAAAPTSTSAIGLTGQTSIAYESSTHLYLTGAGTWMGPCACPMMDSRVIGYGGADKTAIFQFDLVGDEAAHVATGTVSGSIADRWSMDEVGGVLRIATTEMSRGIQVSSVVTLKPSGKSLVQVGRLDGLGRGETLTAARWFDSYAVISTAQQMDPLFTVDLTNPGHPKLLGALHIPGYSSYFHPLGNGLLLGVGQKVSFNNSGEQSQAQVGLFDMSNLRNVRRLSVTSLAQWTYPSAANDPHAFTWLPDHNVALTSFTTQS